MRGFHQVHEGMIDGEPFCVEVKRKSLEQSEPYRRIEGKGNFYGATSGQ